MDKKKLLICSHALDIGGAERSLLDLLYCLDYSRVEVDLFLYRHSGAWMPEIPQQVHLLDEIPEYACMAIPIKETLKRGKLKVLAGRLFGKITAQRYDRKHQLKDSAVALEYSHKYTVSGMPAIAPGKHYDLAVSFLTPHYYAAQKVDAAKKIAWIHTDYTAIAVNRESELRMWDRYDYIASISDEVTKSFLKVLPELEKKIILVENVLAKQTLEKKSLDDVSAEMPPEPGTLKLLSIGRFSYAKNFDQVPRIVSLLQKKGCRIVWYLIGYGDDREILENIRLYGVQESVRILGRKENPYPYIRTCDVYVQPSRYEGKSVTVREAQSLGKPVIITAYATAQSQLEDGKDGIIVPLETEDCAEAMASLLKDGKLLEQVAWNTKTRDYSNREGLEILYEIMGA